MKHILIFITGLLVSFATFAQTDIDVTGNPISNNQNLNSIKLKDASLLRTKSTQSLVIINSIPCPTSDVIDIAFDGENIWVEGYNEFVIFKISPIDGTIIKTIPTTSQHPYGLTFGGQYLWLADNGNLQIHKIDTLDGSVLLSFPTPADPNESFPVGLAWDGNNLWLNDVKNSNPSGTIDSLFQLSTNGNVIASFNHILDAPTGLAFDGTYLWSTDNITDKIYKIDTNTLLAIDSLDAPGGSFPNGLAFDGQYLWVSNNDADSLYQIDIGITTGLPNSILENFSDFFIYPNPATDKITIKITAEEVGSTFLITDQMGRQVLTGKLKYEATTINVNQWALGTYFCQVGKQSKKSIKVMKLIKK